MKTINSIKDINKLPSVLDVDLVSIHLVELVEVLRQEKISSLKGAEAISDLIGYQGYNETGLSVKASEVVLDWIKENYDSSNPELLDCQAANLGNLTCIGAKIYIEDILSKSTSKQEREELAGSLLEIQVRL